MIRAQLPDGTALLFPDDTPDVMVDAKVRDYMNAGNSAQAVEALREELRALNSTILKVGAELVAAELTPRKLTHDWQGKPNGTEPVKERA